MKYICLIGCKLTSVDDYVDVCLVLTIEVYAGTVSFAPCIDHSANWLPREMLLDLLLYLLRYDCSQLHIVGKCHGKLLLPGIDSQAGT